MQLYLSNVKLATYIAIYYQYVSIRYIYVYICLYSLVALVNKGNCLFSTGQYDKARDYYQEALRL